MFLTLSISHRGRVQRVFLSDVVLYKNHVLSIRHKRNLFSDFVIAMFVCLG